MDISAAAQFLGNLINQTVEAGTPLRLSSAQRARFLAWLHAQGQSLPDAAIKGEFSLAALSGASGAAPASAPNVAGGDMASGTFGVPVAVGIDIQSVSELTTHLNVHDLKANPSLAALFTARELSYAQARQQPLETLTGLWAAKEAMRKCLGGPELMLEQLLALEVLPDEHGRPVCEGFSLSISHSAGLAVAVAVRGDAASTAVDAGACKPVMLTTTAPAAAGAFRMWQSAVLLAMAVLISLHVALLASYPR